MNFLSHHLRIRVLMGKGEVVGGTDKRNQREKTEQENAGGTARKKHPWKSKCYGKQLKDR